jgi:hypothetical protein
MPAIMQHDHDATEGTDKASGFDCSRRGGAIWAHDVGATPYFACRIGVRFSEAALRIAHSAARDQARLVAARALAENAALVRRLAASAEQRGDTLVAARLEAEARTEERLHAHGARDGGGPAGARA